MWDDFVRDRLADRQADGGEEKEKIQLLQLVVVVVGQLPFYEKELKLNTKDC